MIKFKNTKGETLLALAEISFKHTVNGEKSLSGTIYTNDDVLHKIDRGWSLEFNNEIYYITYAKPADMGNGITVDFDAVHEFFYIMGKTSVYKELTDGSHTAQAYLDFIFAGSVYSYQLPVNIQAFEKQSFGMDTRLSLFNDFINQTGTEFSVNGKIVRITDKNGSDLSTIVRKGFNLQELGLEYNIGDFVTYAKGFGAYLDEDDHSKGRVEAEYTSPLSSIYGKLESKPISDERYTSDTTLTEKLKGIVDSSYTISVSLELEDLQQAGYQYALPNPGDYILAVDELLGFSKKIRIVSIEVEYDVTGNRNGTKVTCSSISSVEQANESDSTASNTINDLINGDTTIPNSWLDDATKNATQALINTQTELKYTNNGILAIDKNNANNVVIFNSAGIGVSIDGGKTFVNAMTGNGINATAITTGTLRAIDIQGVNINGSTITGSDIIGGSFLQADSTDNMPIGIKNSAIRFYENASSAGENNSQKAYIYGSATPKPTLIIAAGDTIFRMYDGLTANLGADLEIFGGLIVREATVLQNSLEVYSDLEVHGSKNAVHVTRDGIRATPAYETTESYLGDIGEANTGEQSTVTIKIDELFSDMINTDYDYQVFITPYSNANIWVEQRNPDNFVVHSSQSNAQFGWELKAKRRGYEKDRLIKSKMNYEKLKNVEESRRK